MYAIEFTKRYLKDLKLARKRNLPETQLNNIIKLLAEGKKLPEKYKDHSLSGNYIGFRECHIKPDWLLVYRIDKTLEILYLIRTGTHSDLF